jgi:hypothetical protein
VRIVLRTFHGFLNIFDRFICSLAAPGATSGDLAARGIGKYFYLTLWVIDTDIPTDNKSQM